MQWFETAYFNFIVYSILGWVAQGVYVGFRRHKFVNTGFLYGPYVPIYGFGALLVLYLVDPWAHAWWSVFLGTLLLCSVLEYFTSWLLQKLFHRLWWNYSKRPFNLHGRICLLNSVLYGIGGVVITYITNPLMHDLISKMTDSLIGPFEIVFSIIFFSDLTLTLHHMLTIRKNLHVIHQHITKHIEAIHQGNKEAVAALAAHIERDRHNQIFVQNTVLSPYKESLEKLHQHLQDAQKSHGA